MTTSSNSLILCLFLALCSNAVLLLLLLLQLKSGNGNDNCFSKVLDNSSGLKSGIGEFFQIFGERKTKEDTHGSGQVFKDVVSQAENSEGMFKFSYKKNQFSPQYKSRGIHVKSYGGSVLDKVPRIHSEGLQGSGHILKNVLTSSPSLFRIISGHVKRNSFSNKQRRKRNARLRKDEEPRNVFDDGVFAEFTGEELKKLAAPIEDILLPKLVEFESVILRHLDRLNNAMISQDLRIEQLETANLKRAVKIKKERRGRKKRGKKAKTKKNGKKEREKRCQEILSKREHEIKSHLNCTNIRQPAPAKEPQSDVQDNRTDLETVGNIIHEGLIPVDNTTLELTEVESSGDSDITLKPKTTTTTTASTTTSTTSTTTAVPTTEDYMRYAKVFQKVQNAITKVTSLENYNKMVDEVLTKTRSEVVRMDDKVTEMNRKQKNLQTRASMQMYRVAELEMFMNKAEVALHATLDGFERMNGRFDSFKERLTEYSNDLRGVVAQNQRADQLMSELRSADNYKSHDMNEIRTSMMNLEDRINGMYNMLDQSVDTVRNDVRTMVDRICTANSKKIKC